MHGISFQSSGSPSEPRGSRVYSSALAGDRSEVARIKDALGRPVARTVRDRSGRVILNPGDLILHASIERAIASGVLDRLLDSVYRGSSDAS